ncbi:MAG TPA: hypothetical protein VE987_03935 [Polyangiaceae bacterium]|nr:hypothetical protein [Polyangiaceae bacterium]
MRRTTIPVAVALVTLAVALAGCGAAPRLTAAAYRERVNGILDRAAASVLAAKRETSIPGTARALTRSEQVLDRAADEIAALRPPKGADRANRDLAAGIRQYALDVGMAAGSLIANDQMTYLRVTLAAKGPKAVGAAVRELRAAGVDLTALPGAG